MATGRLKPNIDLDINRIDEMDELTRQQSNSLMIGKLVVDGSNMDEIMLKR